MNALELRIPPPLVGLLIAAAMWAASLPGPHLAGFGLGRAILAASLALAGLAISVSGALTFRRAKTTLDPRQPGKAAALVTHGIYRRTRNPMYLGLLLVLLGWAVWLGGLWPLLGPVVFVAYITRFQIAPEERALSALFGDAYRDYAARVRRWL